MKDQPRRTRRTVVPALVVLAVALLLYTQEVFTGDSPRAPEPGGPPRETVGGAVVVERIAAGGQPFTVVGVDLDRGELGLHSKKPDGGRYANFGALRAALERSGRRVRFAANAGIFGPAYAPLGLHVQAGRELAPLNLGDGPGNFYLKPNGVFYIDPDGAAHVVDAATYPRACAGGRVRLAVQSGPLLISGGRIHPAFRADSANRKIRSGVGVASTRRVVFVVSDGPVTFYDLAALFRNRLGCGDALYLDGVISRFWLPGAGDDAAGDFAGLFAVTDGGEHPPPR